MQYKHDEQNRFCRARHAMDEGAALTEGMEDRMLRVGDRGVLAKILSLSFRLRPRGKLPMIASAMKLLCRLADPSDVHRIQSSCIKSIDQTYSIPSESILPTSTSQECTVSAGRTRSFKPDFECLRSRNPFLTPSPSVRVQLVVSLKYSVHWVWRVSKGAANSHLGPCRLTAMLPLGRTTAVGALPAILWLFKKDLLSSCVMSSRPLACCLILRSRHGKLNDSECLAESSEPEDTDSLCLPLNAAVSAEVFLILRLLLWRCRFR